MKKNEQLVYTFYTAFSNRDYATMQSCYHKEVRFSDPVFRNLDYPHVCAMWHMLCEKGTDLSIGYGTAGGFGEKVKISWSADYTFQATKKMVHNRIEAQFYFKDGLIYQHLDSFSLWRWAGMALGAAGSVLGWSSFMQNKIRRKAEKQLQYFMEKHPAYASF